MKTEHKIIINASQNMVDIEDNSINLVVTSPPYPMIEMWDDIFSNQNGEIKLALENQEGYKAFELMHQELDKVWEEVSRVLSPGGFACINIGDATRTINEEFRLYSNHSRIIKTFQKLQMNTLPNIIWRKQTNAPNKFMGSGMLPSGAYVTLEHEWILVFRKGEKRQFKTLNEKLKRQESSFFWEERNTWFSDLWDLKGSKQKIPKSKTRERSAAYPFEIPYRLINMYSLKDDVVLDPFLGTGTTTIAAIASQRNSIGYEIDEHFFNILINNVEKNNINILNDYTQNRIRQHDLFILERKKDKKEIKHFNNNLNSPVVTSQENKIKFSFLSEIKRNNNIFEASYTDFIDNNTLFSK